MREPYEYEFEEVDETPEYLDYCNRTIAEIERRELAQSFVPVCASFNPEWGRILYEDRMPEDLDWLPCKRCGHQRDKHKE